MEGKLILPSVDDGKWQRNKKRQREIPLPFYGGHGRRNSGKAFKKSESENEAAPGAPGAALTSDSTCKSTRRLLSDSLRRYFYPQRPRCNWC
jgi:hypothetical protein